METKIEAKEAQIELLRTLAGCPGYCTIRQADLIPIADALFKRRLLSRRVTVVFDSDSRTLSPEQNYKVTLAGHRYLNRPRARKAVSHA